MMTKSVNPDELIRTIPFFKDVVDGIENPLAHISETSASFVRERKLFRDIQLSGGIVEVIEENDKEEQPQDPMERFIEIFGQNKPTIRQVSVVNPLNLLNMLTHLIYPEYDFLKENMVLLKDIGETKVVRNSLDGYEKRHEFRSLLDSMRKDPFYKMSIDSLNDEDFLKRLLSPSFSDSSPQKKAGKLFMDRLVAEDVNTYSYFQEIGLLGMMPDDEEQLRHVMAGIQSVTNNYASSAHQAFGVAIKIINNLKNLQDETQHIWQETEKMYKSLVEEYLHREKNKVVRNPVMTNVARVLFRDLPGVSEIESGATPKQVSPYNVRKAERLLEALADPSIYKFLRNPESIVPEVKDRMEEIFGIYQKLFPTLFTFANSVMDIMPSDGRNQQNVSFIKTKIQDTIEDIGETLEYFGSLDFGQIKAKAKSRSVSKIHRDVARYAKIANMLDEISRNPSVAREKVFEIYRMHRKERLSYLRKPSEDGENMNYYEATQGPMGNIELVPTRKPRIKFTDVIGESYKETKAHIHTVMQYNTFPAVFMATSPSRSMKSNILLIGPPGCGKTELYRAMASDPKTVVVNVNGASIRNMWHGRSEQNIVSLAESAKKLHEKTGKVVYVVMDEIDNLLAVPSEGNNLADVEWRLIKTFQEILDGVRYYDGVVWCGASNSPERITTASLRRFAFVDSPGELTLEERANVLKHYVNLGLPTRGISDQDYLHYAGIMEGAVGDVIRKVADDIHEKVFSTYIEKNPRAAKELERWLKKGSFDVYAMTKRERRTVKSRIGKYVTVDRGMLEKYVIDTVSSPDIQREIKEAKAAYEAVRSIKRKFRDKSATYG